MNDTHLEVRGEREIVVTRTFDAPAAAVFDVWTRPEHVRRWWAPRSCDVAIVSVDADVRPGGRYRYVLRHGDARYAFSGEYLEIAAPTRLVYTQAFEPTASGTGADDAETLITVTLEESGGRTRLESCTLCPSKEVRDAILASGMEHGLRETMDQLADLLASRSRGPGPTVERRAPRPVDDVDSP